MQHLWFMERVVDIVATRLELDPVEVRKLNYVRAEEMPYTTPNGCVYDSGDYARCLDIALDLIGYDGWRRAPGGAGRVAEGDRDRDRLDARLRHEQLRPVAAREPGAAVLGQQRVGDGAHGAVRRHRRDARHGAAGPGPRDDARPRSSPTSSASRPTRSWCAAAPTPGSTTRSASRARTRASSPSPASWPSRAPPMRCPSRSGASAPRSWAQAAPRTWSSRAAWSA